jgi:hypothetical protein
VEACGDKRHEATPGVQVALTIIGVVNTSAAVAAQAPQLAEVPVVLPQPSAKRNGAANLGLLPEVAQHNLVIPLH